VETQGIDVRRRLPGDVLLVVAAVFALSAVLTVRVAGFGWDAHAYYVAWDGPLYENRPGLLDAYNYSPLFAQAVWPLAQLPWPVFCTLAVVGAALGTWWLVRGASQRTAVALVGISLPEICSGNVYWLLAVAAVLGVGRGAPWCLALLTKILPTVGAVWFLARGQWAPALGFAAVACGLGLVSYAASPQLWHDWGDFLLANAHGSGIAGWRWVPPLAVRLPAALVLTVVAARTSRAWLLPVAMLLATPVVGAGSFALLAAVPRLARMGAEEPVEVPLSAPAGASPGRR